jgi:hypothetical protein
MASAFRSRPGERADGCTVRLTGVTIAQTAASVASMPSIELLHEPAFRTSAHTELIVGSSDARGEELIE